MSKLSDMGLAEPGQVDYSGAVVLWVDSTSPSVTTAMPHGRELSGRSAAHRATAVRTAHGEEIVDFPDQSAAV